VRLKKVVSCQDKTLWLECGCHTEAIQLMYDSEYNMLDITMYEMIKTKYPFMYKLRHIWEILKTGTPYKDQIGLEQRDIKKLIDFLQSISKDKKQSEKEK
jgi:hypothetical protein